MGRRTWSDGDSVGSNRSDLVCAAMKLDKSPNTRPCRGVRESQRSPDTTARKWPENGEANEQQHPVCSLLIATEAPVHPLQPQGLGFTRYCGCYSVSQSRPGKPMAWCRPDKISQLTGCPLTPQLALIIKHIAQASYPAFTYRTSQNWPAGLTFPDPNSTGLRS